MKRFLPLVVVLLVGCGGSDGPGNHDNGDDDAHDDDNHEGPIAAVIGQLAGATAGTALVIDGSDSTGSGALTYGWEFGDGGHGGVATLAHVFADSGSFTIKLTVRDATGATDSAERTIAVSPGPSAQGTVNTLVFVRDVTGVPLAGATVKSGAATAPTGVDGHATVAVPAGITATVTVTKAGYTQQVRRVYLAAALTAPVLDITMRARTQIDIADVRQAIAATRQHGAAVSLPADALVDTTGAVATGAATLSLTPVDVVNTPAAFPGAFSGVEVDGSENVLESYGTVEVLFEQGANRLNLKPGVTAGVVIPMYATFDVTGAAVTLGSHIPLWSLDEATGLWIHEGEGEVIASADAPSGFALNATVGHFSWWNCDAIPPQYHPAIDCCFDNDNDGVCELIDEDCQVIATLHPGEEVFAQSTSTTMIPAGETVSVGVPATVDMDFSATSEGGAKSGQLTVSYDVGATPLITIIVSPGNVLPPNSPVTIGNGILLPARVAVNADGKAVAVWEDYNGVRYLLYWSSFDGHHWTTPQRLDNLTAGNLLSYTYGFGLSGGGGYAIAAWTQNDPALLTNGKNVWASRFNFATASWETEVKITTAVYSNDSNPANDLSYDHVNVAVDEQGNGVILAATSFSSGTGPKVVAWRRVPADATFGSEVELQPSTAGALLGLGVAAKNARIVATWGRSNTNTDLNAAVYDGALACGASPCWTNGWSPMKVVRPAQAINGIELDVAITAQGDAMAVSSGSAGTQAVIFRRAEVNLGADIDGWHAGALIDPSGYANPIALCDARVAVLPQSGGGDELDGVVMGCSGSPAQLWVRNFTDGVFESGATSLYTNNSSLLVATDATRHYDVALAPNGDVRAYWMVSSGGVQDVARNRFLGGVWENTPGTFTSLGQFPQVSLGIGVNDAGTVVETVNSTDTVIWRTP